MPGGLFTNTVVALLLLLPFVASAQTAPDLSAAVPKYLDNPDWPRLFHLIAPPPSDETEATLYAMVIGVQRGWHFAVLRELETKRASSATIAEQRALRECMNELNANFVLELAREAAKNRPNAPLGLFVVEVLEGGCRNSIDEASRDASLR